MSCHSTCRTVHSLLSLCAASYNWFLNETDQGRFSGVSVLSIPPVHSYVVFNILWDIHQQINNTCELCNFIISSQDDEEIGLRNVRENIYAKYGMYGRN
jgi:hypothetical protein